MKHIKLLTQKPQKAQTLLQAKFEFWGEVYPTLVQIWMNKDGGVTL